MRGVGVLSLLFLASPARADYKLNLVGPLTALSSSGDAIQLTGGGSFDPEGLVVKMEGAFTVITREGVAIRRGTWRAHRFERFIPWKAKHETGGVLEVMATLVSQDGSIDQQKMKFICLVNRPEAFGEDEGVTVGPYLEPAGGVIRFK